MASSRWKGDRHYGHLVEGTHKLHKDIDELETAYLLHRKIVDEDQNSVKGLIRKEVGGSRWAHGGAGKLTTYKSSKDLVDQENNAPSQGTARSRQLSRDDQRLMQGNGKVPSSEFNNSSVQNVGLGVKPDTILDLKTKVLKKASSHMIRRDTWAASDETKSVKDRNSSNLKKNESKQDARKTSSASKSQKRSSVKRSNSVKRENGDTSGSPTYVACKAKDKQSKEQGQSAKKTVDKESSTSQRDQSNRRSRLEMFNEIKMNNIESTASLPSSEQKVVENGVHNGDKDSVDRPTTGMTYTPRKLQALNVRNSHRSSESQGIFSTQPPEPTEIYIDPKTCQVRVAAAKEDHFKDLPNLEGTRVFIQPGSVHNSVEGNRLTCSIVDNSVTDSNRKNEIRDIFGLDEFKSHTDDGVSFYKTGASSSPLTTAKQCNTEVEFWLRTLGLPDVDKYVNIFADNDIDLTDLEFMSASQLHDMGVTAFGALDRILKGIRDLKNQSFNHATNHSETKKSGHLTSSSIAWEEVDDNQRKIFSDVKQKASKKENPCHFQTSVKGSFDLISFDSSDRNFERSHSVLSNVSESVDTARFSARSETPNPSFAASTRSSSAKCVEKTRPPSAKCSSVKACVTSQSTSRTNNQSQSKTGSQSAVKLKRSNSSASEKSQSKLKNIENKPNKGVLSRPRSSSLTREASRLKNDRDTSVKRPDEKKEPRQLRARSRSADVVKRKALEGVQAAAKKFEVRNLKCKDSSKTLPPQDEKKKIRRDEMAARHIQREKYKEITTTNDDSSDTDQDEHEQTLIDDDQNLHSLVTVNIMSPQKKTDPHSATQNDKPVAHATRPLVRRSLKGNRSRSGQSSLKPLNLQMETYTEPPLLASYKIGKKDRDTRSPSEPESGYKTDGSTTYSQIEDRVRDIQLKIKRLKARATSGDEMTLTLVHDLQEQLLHFERQLKEKERRDRSQRSGSESNRGDRSQRNGSESNRGDRSQQSGSESNRGDRSQQSGSESNRGDRSQQSGSESNRGDRGQRNGSESNRGDRSQRSGSESNRGDRSQRSGSESNRGDRSQQSGSESNRGDRSQRNGSESNRGDRSQRSGSESNRGDRSQRSGSESNRGDRSQRNGSESNRGDRSQRSGSESNRGDRSQRNGSESNRGDRSQRNGSESNRGDRSQRNGSESNRGDRSQRSGSESNRGEMPDTKESKASDTPRTPLSSARPSVTASTHSTYDTDNSNTETSTVSTVIRRVADTGAVSRRPDGDSFTDGVRMSKQELLDEMRKEKQQHHLQIIQLQSELQRFKHSGPVSSLELDPKDVSFKIEDKIGKGTFSHVYKGEYQGSEVAVKQLNVPLQQQDKNYFAAEVSLLKELRHPRVVLLIGVCTTTKLPVMVLEYMSCGSLHDYLHNPECESLDHALYYQVARDIASGMNYLHSHKPEVLHLDLKSMNVLLCQSLRAKIADFGFSKLRLDVGSKFGRKGKAKTNTSIPAWMSPELLDKGEITGKSDVYSFGIILWEMLTRCFPYKGLSVFQVLEMVRKKSRPDIPDGTPEGLAHLINLCWDHNPAKRPQFKDVLQILENLAFPPAWRELFQKAGVPESALQDINSTRTIISLVTGTLDSGKSSILHSFMVAHGNKGNNSGRSNRQELKSSCSTEKPLMKIKKKGKMSASNSKDSRTKLSSRSSNQTSDWDSDVISSLSDESEFTLKNLRSSSDDSRCEYDSDESSVLSFDEQSLVSKSKDTENTSKKAINVVIPNLALSIQSTRDELRAERQRITGEPDWLSISLDDRSQRSDIDQSFKTSHRNEDSELRLGLKSALSTRTPTPPCLATDEVVANESARSRRRSKSKDLGRYSDEFLRRESFDNRRPPSPKKKTPLTKKLIDSPCRSPAVSRMSLNEMRSKNDRVTPNSKIDSFVEKSYDSFFGHSSHESGMNALSPQDGGRVRNNRHVEDVDFESHHIHALKTESCKVHSNSEPLGRKSICHKDEICVEDMENEVELEMIGKETQVVDEAKSSSKNENGSISSQRLVSNQTTVTVDCVNGSMNYLDNKPEQKPRKLDFNITQTLKENEQFKKGLEASLKCSVDNIESMTKSSAFNINDAESNCSSGKGANNTMQTTEDVKLSRKLVIPEQMKTSKDKSKSASKSTELNTSQIDEESKLFKKQMAGKLEPKSVEVEAKQNDIRVVLNEMLTSKDYITKSDTNISKSSNLSSPRKSGVISDSKSMDYCEEEIRVKLNLEEVSRKKKPAITPRRSVKAKAINNMTNVDLNNGSNTCKPSKVMLYSPKKIEDSTGGSDNKPIDCNDLVRENLKTDESAIKSAKLTKSQKQDVIGIEHDRGKPKSCSKTSANSVDMIPSPKKKTIRVKLKKDPLVPQISREMSSPIPPPPPPPPPPQPLVSKSVQVQAPRSSIADELKLRVANRQSISEGMLRNNKMSKKQNPGPIGRSTLVPKPVESGPKLMNIAELDETLIPQQSEGLPLMVQSMELRGQKDQLRSISKPHPQQFDDLSNASQEQLSSIADILKKAVMNRRLAMGEDGDSVSQSLESAATGWSIDA